MGKISPFSYGMHHEILTGSKNASLRGDVPLFVLVWRPLRLAHQWG
ncbi:MAG TPA: hypothetical protein VFV38_12985 [Ktedonobacteraceae bacterium]|nr:hypothetical protein [Ktedonobacteraceae bacterium]